MIKSYLQGRKMRAALTIGNEWLARVPDVQKRLQARKVGHSFNPDDQDMVFALQNALPLNTGKISGDLEDNGSSDDEISVTSQEKDNKSVTNNILSEKNMNDEDSDEDGDIVAEISTTDESSVVMEVVKPVSRGRGTVINYQQRRSTASFLNYVQARRSSKAVLNGGVALSMAALRPSMLQGEFPDDESEDEDSDDGSGSKTSFNDYVGSGKRLEKFKHDLTEAEKLERRNRRMKQMKFEIQGIDPGEHMQTKGNVSRGGTMYGNVGVELTPAVSAIVIDPSLISSKAHSPKKKDTIRLLGEVEDDDNGLYAPSSYLLHLETDADDISVESNQSKNVLLFQQIKQKRLTDHEIRSAMTDHLKNTSKYGVAKVSHAVGVDPVDLKMLLDSSKVSNNESNIVVTGPKKADDSSVNTDDAMRSNFGESDFIEPSQGKHYHDPFNSDIVNAYEHGQANKQMVAETIKFIQTHPPVNGNSGVGVASHQPYEKILEAHAGRFNGLLSSPPASPSIVLASPAWNVSRAMHGVKMSDKKKQQLVETIQQATFSSIMEQSSRSTFNSLINVNSFQKSTTRSLASAENSPEKSNVGVPVFTDSSPVTEMNAASNRAFTPLIAPDVDIDQNDEFSSPPKREFITAEELEHSLVISEQNDQGKSTADLVVNMPSLYNSQSIDASTVFDLSVQSPQQPSHPASHGGMNEGGGGGGGSVANRSRFSSYSDDTWSMDSNAPDLMPAPKAAVDIAPPTKLSMITKAESKKSSKLLTKDESLTLDMSSYDDLLAPTSNLPSPSGIDPSKLVAAAISKRSKVQQPKPSKYDIKPKASPPKRGMVDPNFASSNPLPLLMTVKPIVELPRVKTTKKVSKKSSTTSVNTATTNTNVEEQSKPQSSPNLCTNSPPLTKRLQSPSNSPVMIKDSEAFVTVLGSSTDALPGYDPRSFDNVDSDIRFFSTSVPAHSLHNSTMSQSQPNFANSAYAPFQTTSTFNLTAGSSHNSSTSNPNLKKVPWLPRGTLTPLDHDRSDFVQGWREKIELLKFQPFDTSKIPSTIRNQTAARLAFEQYAKSFANQAPLALSVSGNVHRK